MKNPDYYFKCHSMSKVNETYQFKKKKKVYLIFMGIRKTTIPVKIRKLIGVTMPKWLLPMKFALWFHCSLPNKVQAHLV